MKKFLRYVSVSTLLMPLYVYADAGKNCDSKLSAVQGLFSFQYCSVNELVVRVITFLLSVIGVVSALMIVWGGYQLVTSAGNEGGVKKGRQTITYAVAGLAVAVLAYTIIAVVNHTFAG